MKGGAYMDIGQKIKSARLRKGYTQEELGNLIGVQKSAVAKYEKGRVVNIKRSVLAKISEVLDIPPVELVTDIEERPVDLANELSEIFLDTELREMIADYKLLDEDKKKQAREFIRFLGGRS
jgi:transcriptional regulator with XRE-family HTH domain